MTVGQPRPHFSDFTLTGDELHLVASVTAEDGSVDWNSARLEEIRARVKALHRSLQRDSCCYCRRSFVGEFALVIDIEHILPKSIYKAFCFSDFNLTVACKRCNMAVKKARIDFLATNDSAYVSANARDKTVYRIIHPNLDRYADHLGVISARVDDVQLVKYLSVTASDKGKFTYHYFRLDELEVDQFDRLQDNGIDFRSDRMQALRDIIGE